MSERPSVTRRPQPESDGPVSKDGSVADVGSTDHGRRLVTDGGTDESDPDPGSDVDSEGEEDAVDEVNPDDGASGDGELDEDEIGADSVTDTEDGQSVGDEVDEEAGIEEAGAKGGSGAGTESDEKGNREENAGTDESDEGVGPASDSDGEDDEVDGSSEGDDADAEEEDDDGIGWQVPAGAGGAAALALAGAYVLTRDDDGTAPTNQTNSTGQSDPDESEIPDDEDDDQDPDEEGGGGEEEDVEYTRQDYEPEIEAPDLSGADVRLPSQQSEFLYTGDDPVQKEVDEEAIDKARVTILRGKVTDGEGEPLEGVTVRAQHYPEFGHTETRETGLFDLVVNGGRQYVLSFEREGFLRGQRKRRVPAFDHYWTDEISLVAEAETTTDVEMNSDTPQVHQAETVEGTRGERTTNLYFPPGTSASTGSDGSGSPTELTVSASEYSVGERGQQRMPAELPPNTGYTYAVELTAESGGADNRQNAGLTRPFLSDASGDVEFSQPVMLYLENFLDVPVGWQVPSGVLERDDAGWTPVNDGRVMEVLGTDDGMATLDISGGGYPASSTELEELNLTAEERRWIASRYDPGESIWRTPIDHFTPYDLNYRVLLANSTEPCSKPRSEGEEEEED